MPSDIPRDDDDGPHAFGLQHHANQASSTGLLPWASRLFTMPRMPSSSTNVTLLNRARNFKVHGYAQLVNAYNLNVVNNHGRNHDLLEIMKPSVSFGALHDSYADDPEHRCRPETRKYVLKRLQGWIDDVTSVERIFWLHGSAGSGKSAIAHTIADSNNQDKVAATFFFCRSDTERNNGNRLVITLAWQLALSIPSIKSHIIQSLDRNPGLPWKSVETQFKELIAQPFQAIIHDPASQALLPSLVVIIDGIDECTDENLQRRILAVIGNAASNAHVPLRFLISSRLEAHIESAIDQLKCPILCIDLRLEKLEELVSFDAIHNSHGQSLTRRWKSSSNKHTVKQLQGWVNNTSSVERIAWLYGPDDSAMAQAVADLNGREKVVATFFFLRSDATRNDGTRLFPTLCWQFASSISTYKDYIIRYLAEPFSYPSQDVRLQFEHLIAKPFEALKAVESQEQPLDYDVIIDGIDECADLEMRLRSLEVIGKAVRTRRVPLRFLIASRSEGLTTQEAIDCFQCPVFSIDLGIVPVDTGTSTEPFYNLEIARPKDHEGYRYQSLHIGLLPELAITSTFPATYDGVFSECSPQSAILPQIRRPPWIRGISVGSSRGSRSFLLDFEDGAHVDITKYLKEEFSRIATKQGIAKTWPSQRVIEVLAHRSSGHFIYANTIVELISEGLGSAETLLNLILDLQPRTETPFAHLDELYIQILKWQPDQVFLKDVLALVVVRSSILKAYYDDDVVLMNVSWQELRTKLWGMRSLLHLVPCIDVHHLSLLDFLQDASRSGQYHIGKEEGLRRYLKLITGSLVHYVNKVHNQPEYHENHHFTPRFSRLVTGYPRRIELPVTEWQEALQPLLKCGRKAFISCPKCTAFRIIRDLLLHFAILRGISSIRSTESTIDEAEEFEEHIDETTVTDDILNNCLSTLLAHLRSQRYPSGPTDTAIMTQMCTVLSFDCAEIAARIHSVSDAQNLVDVIVDMLDEDFFLDHGDPDVKHKAILLVLEIYAGIPVLPRSLFLEGRARSDIDLLDCRSLEIEILCQSALIGKILDKEYIIPVSRVCEEEGKFIFLCSNVYERSESLRQWRRRANPSVETVVQVMLGVAKAFQYLHSMGIVPYSGTNSYDIFLDSTLSPKIRFFGTFLLYIVKTPSICLQQDSKVLMTREANVFNFGCLFYEMAFNVEITHEDRIPHEARYYKPPDEFKIHVIVKRSTEPDIPDNMRKLIQLCCGDDPKRRPTMDEVVMEMESWGLPPLPDPQDAPPEDKIGPN